MLNEKDSLENKVACIEKENEFLKNENVSLMSKLNDLCEGNTSLKNKISLVEKQKEIVLQENNSLKGKFVEKVSKKKMTFDHALHATTSIDQNEVKFLKKKIDCLSSTLSLCDLTTLDWSLCFQRNKLHILMHIIMHMLMLHAMIIHIHIAS